VTTNFAFPTITSLIITQLQICKSPHDGFPIDLGSAATMNTVTASGILFHNCATPHDCFRVVVHICTTPHDGFPVDVGSATMMNVIASGVLFHNCTMPYGGLMYSLVG
jgi:hypothetical protein